MLRAWPWLLLLAGCDTVFGLERDLDGHDEDDDGAPDAVDSCPHLADVPQMDSDGDGIGDACDPNGAAQTASFFSFHDERDGLEGLLVNGVAMIDGDDLMFGTTMVDTPETLLLAGPDRFPIEVDAGWIELGFTIVDPAPDDDYHETGIVFGHVAVSGSNTQRGIVCFAGYDKSSSGTFITYLQVDENDVGQGYKTSAATLRGNRATLSGSWIDSDTSCVLTADGVGLDHRHDPTIARGRLGVYQQQARTRLHYLWIVTRP